MDNAHATPADVFTNLLSFGTPAAVAWIKGGASAPAVSGLVKFYQTPYQGVLVEAELFNLPNKNMADTSDFYAMHIHQNGDCSDNFANTGEHYNPSGTAHPNHTGDLPPILGNGGYGWSSFYDKRFHIDEIIGRSVVIHCKADDFRSQPAGNSGGKIACGTIQRTDTPD